MSTIVSLKPTFSCNQVNRIELVQRNKRQIVFDFSKGIKPALTKQQSLETSKLLQNKASELKSSACRSTLQAIGHIFLTILSIATFALLALPISIALSNIFLLLLTIAVTAFLLFVTILMVNEFSSYASRELAEAKNLREAANSLSQKIPFFQKMALQKSKFLN